MPKPKFLIVLTSQDMIPTNRATTGWYLSELAHPYTILSPHLHLTISSPQGGEAPLDAASASQQILENDPVAREFLEQNRGLWTRTTPLREVVCGVTEGEFVGVLFVGGHGPMYDLPTHPSNLAILQSLASTSSPDPKVIAAVCHGPAALLNATTPSGLPLLSGTTLTGFSNEEEEIVGMHNVLPFELQTELERVTATAAGGGGGKGGYVKADKAWGEKVVVSRSADTGAGMGGAFVVTGQNPASAAGVARGVLGVLGLG
ncbi:ThiJ/PfpI family protein [Aspergillus glaucus CBS 516.65]|uniref:D-lactate dehydratase n=1 Tax=Aspergillus glaucus CBS 516.65 TaxID=1160497 RepID=A0A1L9V7L8_ASPGL|nr:hypothetical protein ASPGLDRAFT_135853 [Aspergillus glaucus CBS 516.65]OJJ79906.1 hypothetical protein ASPGLDRAFT_135853 [Aspergillus glaucus CBS 516.65]